jgi:hypothetical protein
VANFGLHLRLGCPQRKGWRGGRHAAIRAKIRAWEARLMQGWVIILVAIAYVSLLFAIASLGDRHARSARIIRLRPLIYSLSLAIYCTSWTFFGSVGLASERGIEYLTIYIGPALVFLFGFPLLRRIIRLAKTEKITSVADFLAARYGKSFAVASIATLIATLGAVPYIALQLKAISGSVNLMVDHYSGGLPRLDFLIGDVSLAVTLLLAMFAVLFGTRHADATEHQDGLVLAVAVESLVKLAAFIAVGLAVIFLLLGGVGSFVAKHCSEPAGDRSGELRNLAVDMDRGDDHLWLCHLAAAAPVLCHLCRKPQRTRIEDSNVAVSTLSGADQYPGSADRLCGLDQRRRQDLG